MALLNKKKKDGLQPIIIKKVEGGHEANHDESNWLVSYADMMTLLCGFFIMMFSMATLDVPKYDSFKEAVSKQFGGEYTSPTKENAKFATQILQELGVSQESIVYHDALGIAIVFESTMFFDTLSAEVRPEGRKVLDGVVDAIAKRQQATNKQFKIVVEGHTDDRPILSGTFPSNWELSGARASRVVRLFLDHGFAQDRLTAIGYAHTRPWVNPRRADGTQDEKLLAKNRRVVLRILEPGNESIPYPVDPANPYTKKFVPEGSAPASAEAVKTTLNGVASNPATAPVAPAAAANAPAVAGSDQAAPSAPTRAPAAAAPAPAVPLPANH